VDDKWLVDRSGRMACEVLPLTTVFHWLALVQTRTGDLEVLTRER
jgi:hypothetical protein